MQIGSVSPGYSSSAHAAQLTPPQVTPQQGAPPQAIGRTDRDGDKDGSTSAASDSTGNGKQVNVLA
jgi:hypothetical protein